MNKLNLPNNAILIINKNIKKNLLKELVKEKLTNIKIMTINELRKKIYFDYNEHAIYYLMEKYNYQYDVAKMYLSHLHEVENNSFNSTKIKKIIDLKEELKQNNLLIYNYNFKDYLKNKTIILYECNPLSNIDLKMIKELEKICKIQTIEEKIKNYNHNYIYQFNTIEEEVTYIATKISELKESGISFNNIKICGANGEYLSLIKRIFEWYHIPITFQDNYLFSTKIGQEFLNNLNDDISITLKYIEETFSLTNQNNIDLYNKIIQITNKYAWATNNFTKIKYFLIEDFKNTITDTTSYQEEIKLIDDLSITNEEDYIFLLGFNQGDIPKYYKDESYFNDNLKQKLGLETTNELNKNNYSKWLKEIKNTKNLIITTKLTSSLGEHYLSSLNDDLKLEIKKEIIPYNYSNIYNKLKLGEKIDKLIKYGEKEADLDILYSNYSNIPYGLYNQEYQEISPSKIKHYLNNKLVLSYSAMNTYYQCSFRYYLANILKLNIFEETFYTVLGNLFHYILSIALTREIDLKKEYSNYISKCTYEFNSREKFFLNKLEKELEFIINTIKKQNEYNSLTKTYFEEKIEIDKSKKDMNIIFKGFVDKMMTNEKEDVIAIIDYKTGNPDLNLNHIIYGLDLQLPVYIYLSKKRFPIAKVAGFYLQKILNNEINRDYKHTYEFLKEDKLKLQGYSNSEIAILEQFDSGYYESKTIKGMRMTSKGIGTKKVLNQEKIEKLVTITEQKIDDAIEGILSAKFDINPKRVGMNNLGCKYCGFKDICFSTEKDIKDLKEYKNMEFLEGDENDTKETE